MELLKTVVAEVFANEVPRLSRLNQAVELLLTDSGSPWFNVMAREDFLPAALLVLGRGNDAVAVIREVRSTYGPSHSNQARATAYEGFADRVQQMISGGKITGSTDSRFDVEALVRSGLH
ncbi:hypothetical protein OU995_09795 [Roseateles sp. SL47]|uniref:hypothetical protein n=1 Tax=Roseateles sp. SL47 TaxID=2995138 RepID=UPI0022718BA7|nr:hypothetical protein [Roseateles sp. SL47]WAC74960.1 hypothetical protein OU995_09795 [Roseateles sp. SL47]